MTAEVLGRWSELLLSVVALFLALFELGDFWGLGISQIFDWETLQIDDSVDAIGIAYAGF